MVIKDETTRMIAHTFSAESMCDSDCKKCKEDERFYEGLVKIINPDLLERACPVSLALVYRIEEYNKKNPNDYVTSQLKKLQLSSIGNTDPKEIRRSIMSLRASLMHIGHKTPTEFYESPSILL